MEYAQKIGEIEANIQKIDSKINEIILKKVDQRPDFDDLGRRTSAIENKIYIAVGIALILGITGATIGVLLQKSFADIARLGERITQIEIEIAKSEKKITNITTEAERKLSVLVALKRDELENITSDAKTTVENAGRIQIEILSKRVDERLKSIKIEMECKDISGPESNKGNNIFSIGIPDHQKMLSDGYILVHRRCAITDGQTAETSYPIDRNDTVCHANSPPPKSVISIGLYCRIIRR